MLTSQKGKHKTTLPKEPPPPPHHHHHHRRRHRHHHPQQQQQQQQQQKQRNIHKRLTILKLSKREERFNFHHPSSLWSSALWKVQRIQPHDISQRLYLPNKKIQGQLFNVAFPSTKMTRFHSHHKKKGFGWIVEEVDGAIGEIGI